MGANVQSLNNIFFPQILNGSVELLILQTCVELRNICLWKLLGSIDNRLKVQNRS